MADTLLIVRNADQERNWTHFERNEAIEAFNTYFESAFFCEIINGDFAVRLFNGSKFTSYNFSNIRLRDDFSGTTGTEYTPTSETDLVNWLKTRDYTAFFYSSSLGGSSVLQAGTGVTITGDGSTGNPYIISSSGGGSGYDSLQAMYDIDPSKLYVTDGVNTLSIDPANIFVSSDILTSSVEPTVGAFDVSGAQAYNTITNASGNVIGQNYVLDNDGHSYLSRGDGSTVMKSNDYQVGTRADNITANRDIQEADASGTRVMSVNGTPADTSGNVVVGTTGAYIPLAGTDVGSPVTGEILISNGTQGVNYTKSGFEATDGVGNTYGVYYNPATRSVFYGIDNEVGGSAGFASNPAIDMCELKVHGAFASEGSLRTYATDTRLSLNSPGDIGTATIKQSNDDFYISTADAGNEIKLQFPSPNSGANGVASIKPITDGSTKPLAYVEDVPTTAAGLSNTPAGNIAATNLQTAINELDSEKQPTITGAATTITGSNLIANRAVISNGSGKVAVSAVTDTELGYVAGATSNLQAQINAKGSGTVTNVTSSDSSTATVATETTTPVITIVSAPKLQTARTIAGVSFDGTANIAIAASGLSNGTTGSGSVVLATSPTLVTPALGTPSAVVLTNGTGLPESGVTNLVTDLAAKAPLSSPAFTGNPTAPTATANTNSTQLATTAYADSKVQNSLTPSTTVAPSATTVNTALALKADDASVVHLAATETVTGAKTFALPIIMTGQASPTYAQGKFVYNTDTENLTFFNNNSQVAHDLGRELWKRCYNNTGSTIANGVPVYITGYDAGTNELTIGLANAAVAATTVAIGLTTQSIPNATLGEVTPIGDVHGLNTASFTSGLAVYLGTTAGTLTQTAPTAPNYRYRVGFVGKSDATTGFITVTPSTAALGNGTANQIEGMNAAGTAKEVKSIVGTANQVAVTNTAGQIQFGFPSTIVIPTGSTATTPAQNDYSTTVATTAYVDRRFPFMRLSSAYVLTSQTALQKAFNVGASAGGALTAGTRLYYFTGQISLSALSATNGTVSFGWLGTATIGSVRYTSFTVKAATPAASLMGNVTATAGTVITATTTGTTAVLQVSGYVSVSGAGTLIPAVGMSVAAPANVDANSGIVFNDLGASTATASPDVN